MNKKIIFSSGGTGGHIFPAINLMKYLSEKEYETILVTDKRGSKFLEKNSKFRSYIIDSDTPTNKNFIKKVLSNIKKGKAKLDNWFWWLCVISNFFFIQIL